MSSSFRKTAAGRAEIRDRALALSRTARNLLLIIEPSQPAEHWLAMLLGASESDLVTLLKGGLIEPMPRSAPAPSPAQVHIDAATQLSYSDLYDCLNGLIREQLGLFKGYRFSLDIEKASGLDELVEVARRFIDTVHEVKGPAAAQMVARALGFLR
ncbi:MAG: hypothetical protein RL722_1582 [Pseudomonadota bacterium]|jgi:hypothetical protein